MATKAATALGSAILPRLVVGGLRESYQHLRDIILLMQQGRSNSIGEVEIEDGDSPVTVTDARCTENSVVLVMLGSSDLATNLTYWISSVANGQFVLEFSYGGGTLSPVTVRYAIIG